MAVWEFTVLLAGSELGSAECGMPVAPTAFSVSPWYKTVGVELLFVCFSSWAVTPASM